MKRLVPYPLFLIIATVLERVVISSTQIDLEQSLRSLFVLLLLTSIAILILQTLIKDWHYTNFIILIVWVMLLAYRSLYRLLKINLPQQADYLALALIPLLCAAYIAIVNGRVWRSIRNPARLTYYFSLVFLLLLSFQVVRLAEDIYKLLMTETHSQMTAISRLTNDIHLQNEMHPDIYVIILDGYARQDVLQNIYHHDNSEFISQLEKRGFYVANDSHSNYVETPHAMASFWNFDYLQSWNPSYDYVQYLLQPIQASRTFRLLDEIGYTTVSFEGAMSYTEIKNSDVYLSDFLPLNKFETLLLIDSPLEALTKKFNLGIAIPTYKAHRRRILYEIDTLKEIPISIQGSKIVYSHMLVPHPPFVFDQNGNALEPQRPYSIWDGNEYEGDSQEYRNGYREQVIFINTEIIKVIDAILAKSEAPPVILLMGDHGPGSMFSWDFDTPSCVWERTSNLYAMLLPGHLNDGTLYPSISPVNTFRVIFNTYFGTNLPLLEDKSYLMSWHRPTLEVDVTNIRDSLEKCVVPHR